MSRDIYYFLFFLFNVFSHFVCLCDTVLYTWFEEKWKRLKKFWGRKICLVYAYFFKHLSLSTPLSFMLKKKSVAPLLKQGVDSRLKVHRKSFNGHITLIIWTLWNKTDWNEIVTRRCCLSVKSPAAVLITMPFRFHP